MSMSIESDGDVISGLQLLGQYTSCKPYRLCTFAGYYQLTALNTDHVINYLYGQLKTCIQLDPIVFKFSENDLLYTVHQYL